MAVKLFYGGQLLRTVRALRPNERLVLTDAKLIYYRDPRDKQRVNNRRCKRKMEERARRPPKPPLDKSTWPDRYEMVIRQPDGSFIREWVGTPKK